MTRGNVTLNNPERYLKHFRISEEKLDTAIKAATDKLKEKIEVYGDKFVATYSKNYRYPLSDNTNWVCGMFTGCYNLAYELTKDEVFLCMLKTHMASYQNRAENRIELEDHDVGFVFSPSCVAFYKMTGSEEAKEAALKAAEILYEVSYSEKGGFVLRWGPAGKSMEERYAAFCRTMMDTMFNIPLFFWAAEMTGEEKYLKAALSQCDITNKYLVRADGSTNHHYQFEQGTYKPLYGVTLQGNSNDSTWSRGHSWGVYGYPIAYSYIKEAYMLPLQRDLTYYFLNHLPEDYIPYWDFDFISGDEPRDTSAAAVAACGMLEAVKYMEEVDINKEIYVNAAHLIINSIIDRYTKNPEDYDGLITGVTVMRRSKNYEDEGCTPYGDYFYLEALMRMKNPDWNRYW